MSIDSVSRPDKRFSLTARWVFPVTSPPLEGGVVEIEDDRIVAVHNRPDSRAIALGDVALLPALVNAHTHLEFSDLTAPLQPAQPFTSWIGSLVGVRRSRPATARILQQGLHECRSAGTVIAGEIATSDWSDADYRLTGLRTTVFRELLAPTRDRIESQREIAKTWLANPPSDPSVVRGLSPHAPYTVHPDLYRDLVQLAAETRAPLAIHLAETTSELEFLRAGKGEFVEMLKRFNAWDETAISRGTRPLDYLKPLDAVSRALIIHGNYLAVDELDWLARRSHVSVVYCPRTHAFFGHSAHPWLQMLDRGINVALGTDSRGSNPDLSVWGEMQFLAAHFPHIDPARVLSMGTLIGAHALGHEKDLGSLEPGKQAEFAIVQLGAGENGYRQLFANDAKRLLIT